MLQDRYLRHLGKQIELADKEMDRTRWDPVLHPVAKMYRHLFGEAEHLFRDRYQRNLINAFRHYQDQGNLEIITCAATHGYLPLMLQKEAVRAQIAVAVKNHRRVFGRPPRGIWLPECGYIEGLDQTLKEFGLRFFFTEAHGVLYASTKPKYGIYAPIYCPSGVAAFPRDLESSKQVWSADEGYPGDFDYRDFYRDIGYDLDYNYIRPYIHPDGIRVHTGIKYHRITGSNDPKEPYNPAVARDRAATHAGNFMFNRCEQLKFLAGIMDRKPLVVAPYDAELFGHWWFEGPMWLEYLFRKIHFDQDDIQPITPSEYLQEYPCNQMCTPSASSWGLNGYHEVWLEGSNDWIYRHLHKAAERMVELANRFPSAHGITRRALAQAAREILLAQSSDWAFIMKTGTMVEYAVKRTKSHIHHFNRLYQDILTGQVDDNWLGDLESKNNIFPEIDYRVYQSTGT